MSERIINVIDVKLQASVPLGKQPIRLKIVNANSKYEDMQHTTQLYLRNFEVLGNSNPLPLILLQVRVPVEDNYVVISTSQTAGSTPQFFWGPYISCTVPSTNISRCIVRANQGRDFPMNNAELVLWCISDGGTADASLKPFTDYTTLAIELAAIVNPQFK